MWGVKSRLQLRVREGLGRGSEKGKRKLLQKGERGDQKGEGGVDQKKHKRRPHESTALPEGRLPAGVSAAITKSSCIPLRSSETL